MWEGYAPHNEPCTESLRELESVSTTADNPPIVDIDYIAILFLSRYPDLEQGTNSLPVSVERMLAGRPSGRRELATFMTGERFPIIHNAETKRVAMATQWFCRLMGAELGPFSAREMVELVQHRRLTPEDLIRKGPQGEWVPAYIVQGLFDAAAQTPPTSSDTSKTSAQNPSGKNQGANGSGKASKSTLHPAQSNDGPGPSSLSGLLSALLLGHRAKSENTAPPPKAQPVVVARRTVPAADTPASPPKPEEVPRELGRWFCLAGGERRGPMSFDALKRFAAAGNLKPDDRVWSTSCPRRLRANEIPELTFQ